MNNSINNNVLDPREGYKGRMPKTDTYVQVTGNRVLIRCTKEVNELEVNALALAFSKRDDVAIRSMMSNPIVCAYGDGTTQVEIGDSVILGDNYSVIKISIPEDKNDLDVLSESIRLKLNLIGSQKELIARSNELAKAINNENIINPKYKVNVYFIIDEFLIVGRNIKTPNA